MFVMKVIIKLESVLGLAAILCADRNTVRIKNHSL